MAANEKARSAATDTGQGVREHETHAKIIARTEGSVNTSDRLKDFRVRHRKLNGTQIVEAIRSSFPGFDKSLLSKVQQPEKYGVCLTPEAEQALENTFEGENKDDIP